MAEEKKPKAAKGADKPAKAGDKPAKGADKAAEGKKSAKSKAAAPAAGGEERGSRGAAKAECRPASIRRASRSISKRSFAPK